MQSKKEEGEPKKIVLTGGHAATTAVAVIEEILRRKEPWELFWIGAKTALEGEDVATLDVEIFPKLGVRFHGINTGRLQRTFSRYTLPSLLKIPWGFIQALRVLTAVRPDLVVSFGGYVSFPVVFWARVLGVRVILHEQTAAAGRSNKASILFATKIALARKESLLFFPKNRAVVTGNPVMTQICEIKPKVKMNQPPVIFVTGGSRGSATVNALVFGALRPILQNYFLIHQTGFLDYQKALELKKALPPSLAGRYEIYSRIDPLQIDGVYKRADIVIARAGANTVSEIMVAKIPAILIPIPWAYADEQNANAKLARDFGVAAILPQDSATPAKLLALIEATEAKWPEIVRKIAAKDSPDRLAAGKLVNLLEENLL